MKEWLKWLEQCEYKFVRTDNGEDNIREYDFGHGIRVVKKESGRGSRGGMVEVNGFTTWHGSVKELIARIIEVIEQAEEQIVEEVLAEEVEVAQEQHEEVQTMTEEELDLLAVNISIKIVLDAMHKTLDSNQWELLNNEYIRLKAKQNSMMKGGD